MPDFQLAVHGCPTVNERTTRDDLISQGLKPEAADELIAFRDRVMQTAPPPEERAMGNEFTIWKFTLALEEVQSVKVPSGATPLCVQMQGGALALWMRVEPDAIPALYRVTIVGTGHPIPPYAGAYISTVQAGAFVWHFFGAWQ